ncbi:MAG: Lrp/AsnC ligand binding domain-containing protein [Candidatus Hodarchaeota archaeon]
MTLAFTLIQTEVGREDEIRKVLLNIEGVVEAHIIYGVYDIICKLEAPTMEHLKDVLILEIQGLANIRSILSLIAIKRD